MSFSFAADPFISLDQKVAEATAQGIRDANAMTLATVGQGGRPAARIVLYKGLVRGGLSFYTNFESRKGRELDAVRFASAVFFWPSLHEQIRLEGEVEKLRRDESEAYFRTRPRESQIGAWASAQSEEIADLEVLAGKVGFFERQFAGQEVPCPPHWGGYRLIPEAFEFWIGRPGRLHERYCFEKQGDGWRRFMRSP